MCSLILQHCLNIFIFNISQQTRLLINFFFFYQIKYCFNVFQCWKKNIILTTFQCWNMVGWSKPCFLREKMYIKYHEEAEKYQDNCFAVYHIWFIVYLLESSSTTSSVCLMLWQGLRGDGMAEGDESAGGEWKEKCMALEALLFKFRGQMSVIRELTAEKVSQTHYSVSVYVSVPESLRSACWSALWPLKIITSDRMLSKLNSTYLSHLLLK